mmetsp:Transcript_17594/g.39822  ORF Transcript_17594/g.39822 Transcript_17594/m.39822 type:complete len:337 (+) Transcript_17594:1467-2477(+)
MSNFATTTTDSVSIIDKTGTPRAGQNETTIRGPRFFIKFEVIELEICRNDGKGQLEGRLHGPAPQRQGAAPLPIIQIGVALQLVHVARLPRTEGDADFLHQPPARIRHGQMHMRDGQTEFEFHVCGEFGAHDLFREGLQAALGIGAHLVRMQRYGLGMGSTARAGGIGREDGAQQGVGVAGTAGTRIYDGVGSGSGRRHAGGNDFGANFRNIHIHTCSLPMTEGAAGKIKLFTYFFAGFHFNFQTSALGSLRSATERAHLFDETCGDGFRYRINGELGHLFLLHEFQEHLQKFVGTASVGTNLQHGNFQGLGEDIFQICLRHASEHLLNDRLCRDA